MTELTPLMPGGKPIPLDRTGRIADDLPCYRCGHNLRGQSLEGRCGECGQLVSRAVGGTPFVDSDPRWVRRLANGSTLVALSFLLGMIWLVASAMVVTMADPWGPVAERAVQGSGLAVGVLAVIALLMVTSREPDRMRRESMWSARRLVRVAVVITPVVAIAMNPLVRAAPALEILLQMALAAGPILIVTALLRHMHHLARRIPDANLVDETHTLFIMVSTSGVVVLVVLALVGLLFRFGVEPVGLALVLSGLGCLGVVSVGLIVWALGITAQFQHRLAMVARDASRRATERQGMAEADSVT